VKLKQRILRIQEMLLCVCRKWWRPLTCMGLMASVFVNLVLIPWVKKTPIEFSSASAFVGAIVAAFAVREWGKTKGVGE
jgi:uncharacterized membrane protein